MSKYFGIEKEINTVMKKTNAARLLDTLKINYSIREYEVNENDLSAVTVAAKIGMCPAAVFKTLVAKGDKTGVLLAVLSAEAELDLKALAAASGNKSVTMVSLSEVLPLTGYVRGGVSPLGMKKNYPVFIDETILSDAGSIVSISAGIRGAQLLLAPKDLIRAAGAVIYRLARQ
jgi:Cys-tRNA(Pro)/Cys-tRNA(Cys) deacylase